MGQLPTPVFWPGEFHGLYSPWGCRVRHDWATFTFNLPCILGQVTSSAWGSIATYITWRGWLDEPGNLLQIQKSINRQNAQIYHNSSGKIHMQFYKIHMQSPQGPQTQPPVPAFLLPISIFLPHSCLFLAMRHVRSVPRPGIKPVPLPRKHRVLTTGLPGKSLPHS